MPAGYTTCQQADCPRANTCLRQLAYESMMAKAPVLSIFNPRFCTKNDTCPHFRDSAPVTYAREFTGMQRKMFPTQYQTFMSFLMSRFGRTSYFKRRRGETPLSPKEQKLILQALRLAGVSEELKFDQYEENINWQD